MNSSYSAIMQNAFVGGALVGFISSYFGVFVVQRRMAFLGSGLAHAAFGGIALGLFAGIGPIYVAVPFTVAVAIAIVWVRESTALAEDTVIGVLFAAAMALGVIFIQLRESFSVDAQTYLFGSVLAITPGDVWIAAAMTCATLMTLPLWSAWAYATFDRSLARTDRLRVTAHDYALVTAIAVATVVSIKIVGMLLVAAFLVLPAATARLLSRSFLQMTLLALLIGATTPAAGLYISTIVDFPPSGMIVLLQVTLFGIALGLRRVAQ